MEREQGVGDLIERAAAIRAEATAMVIGRSSLSRGLDDSLRDLVDESREILAALMELYDDEPADEGALPWLGDDLSAGEPGHHAPPETCVRRHIADTCFLARNELTRARRSLEAGRHQGEEERLVACERARRKIRRGLGAVVAAVQRATGEPPTCDSEAEAELEAGIAVRAMYARFRRSLRSCDPADPDSVRRSLRYAAASLAVMVGCDEFSDVRFSDRQLLLSLQARIFRWAKEGGDPTEGARLCADLHAAAELLRGINLRQEIQEHDARVIAQAREDLRRGDREAALARLRLLRGRDDGLDDLVRALASASEDGPDAADAVRRIAAALDGALSPPVPE